MAIIGNIPYFQTNPYGTEMRHTHFRIVLQIVQENLGGSKNSYVPTNAVRNKRAAGKICMGVACVQELQID